ncbi:MAG TPA: DUF5069 domain-containing protein [Alphaproteobacteria bacterium]|nr:DUF5069 domain-containing protein [Alphaproteobacteria bacterium]
MKTEIMTLNAKDLTKEYPRSPRETLAGYVIAARMLDKCRAAISGTLGEYHFDCPLDRYFLQFAGIDAESFRSFVETGADDDAVAAWIEEHATRRSRIEVIKWNNQMREKRLGDMPENVQEFLEGYIPEFLPAGCVVYRWFDVYDIEEKRI